MLASKKMEIRNRMAAKLQNKREEDVRKDSRTLCAFLETLPHLKTCSSVFAFYPLKGEVDLRFLFPVIFSRGIDLYLPRVEGKDLIFSHFTEKSPLKENTMGIQEPLPDPAGDTTVPLPDSLILLPGLAFDSFGGRLGRGGGYYDRWLGRSKSGDLKIKLCGVCYQEQLLKKVPREEWDLPVEWIVTERGSFPCEGNS